MVIKIDQTGHIRPAVFEAINNKSGFGEILNGKIAEMSRTAPSFAAEKDLINRSFKVLDLLDDYARELKNPQKTLREIEPLVARIENEMGTVDSKAGGIASAVKEIEQFVKELSVTANVAVLKFRRGDYL